MSHVTGTSVEPGSAAKTTERQSLSAVILAKNEEARIAACLESLRWVDEVVVVDDESTDRTRELCRAFGATVIVRRSGGDFDAQRNAGIDAARGTWIFQLDADEVVPAPLREEVLEVLKSPGDVVAYGVKRRNIFLGHEMRHGGWRWHGVKLFKKLAARYVGHSVHEKLAVDGPMAGLAQPINHYPFQGLAQFMERQNFYTDVEARLLRQDGRAGGTGSMLYHLIVRPLKVFWKSYVRKAGYREGLHGLVFGALFAWVDFLKWAKCWALGLPAAASTAREIEVPRSAPADPSGRERLSVVVITKNEEDKIARCLESVRWADELIVVDGLSTDRTVEICRSLGATVIPHAFDGSFASDRNLGMAHARGDWVLQIDADDVATPVFRAAVEGLLRRRPDQAVFKFRRRSVLLGRVMRHGGWHYAVPNLLRRDAARYEGLVHERPRVRGAVGELEADVEHHPCADLSAFLTRQNRYTSLQAVELCRAQGPWTAKAIAKQIWTRPWKTFWKSYVKKAGYREGMHGLVFAGFFAGVELLKWSKAWERCCLQETRTR